MPDGFRDALLWHMDQHSTKISDLVTATSVSRDVINKLKARPGSSTTVENAILIARHYGKSVNGFVARTPSDATENLGALIDALQPAERRLILFQISGILSSR